MPLFRQRRRALAKPTGWRFLSLLKLVGQRVSLTVPDPQEAERACDFVKRNRQHLASTNSAVPPDYFGVEFWRRRLRQGVEDLMQDRALRLFLLHPEGGGFIGAVNYTQIFRGAFQACYLGYSIDAEFEGLGLMSDALRTSLGYVFEELRLHRVMANHLPENLRSARLLQRVGFQVEGRASDYLFVNGAWREHVMCSCTNPDWRPRAEDAALFEE